MLVKIAPSFAPATKVTSLAPGKCSMTIVMRGTYRLAPGAPLQAIESPVERGYLSGDRFHEADEERKGELLHADDFADFKLKTDVLLRGTCHPAGGRRAHELRVAFGVGSWSKALAVFGRRVWTHRAADPIGNPASFVDIPLTWANAFGGPDYAPNPVGRGRGTPELPCIEDPRALVRTPRDAPSPAGFGPINPAWPQRSGKRGTEYGKEWRKTRAPFYARDFDWSFFNAAPPDQQLSPYLVGDEELWFEHLHPDAQRWKTRLPAVRPRAFVRYANGTVRETPMNLDTLLADVDGGRLYLTWRGLAPVAEDDLADVRTLFVAEEPFGAERSESEYVAMLEEFERDPLEKGKQIPPEVKKAVADAKALAAQRPAIPPREGTPMQRLEATIAEQEMSEEDRKAARDALAKARGFFEKNEGKLAELKQKTTVPPTRAGFMEALAKQIADHKAMLAKRGISVAPFEKLEASLKEANEARAQASAKLRAMAAANPRAAAGAQATEAAAAAAEAGQGAPPPAPPMPGPGADLMGRDLSRHDLSGLDLSAALMRRAKLVGAKLSGANLSRADLSDADLSDADLRGANLDQCILMGARLVGARLDGARLEQTVLSKADLTRASLVGARIAMAMFLETVLEEATFKDATIFKSFFSEARMARADLAFVTIEQSTLREVVAPFARFDDAKLLKASFMRSKLEGASFVGAQGEGNAWQKASLERADFRFAVLPRSFFSEARLDDAKLHAVRLRGSSFYRASLVRTDLSRSDLMDANFGKARLAATSFVGSSLFNAKLFGVVATEKCDFTGANLKRAMWELPG